MLARLARTCYRRRRIVVGLWLLVFVLGIVFGVIATTGQRSLAGVGVVFIVLGVVFLVRDRAEGGRP